VPFLRILPADCDDDTSRTIFDHQGQNKRPMAEDRARTPALPAAGARDLTCAIPTTAANAGGGGGGGGGGSGRGVPDAEYYFARANGQVDRGGRSLRQLLVEIRAALFPYLRFVTWESCSQQKRIAGKLVGLQGRVRGFAGFVSVRVFPFLSF